MLEVALIVLYVNGMYMTMIAIYGSEEPITRHALAGIAIALWPILPLICSILVIVELVKNVSK